MAVTCGPSTGARCSMRSSARSWQACNFVFFRVLALAPCITCVWRCHCSLLAFCFMPSVGHLESWHLTNSIRVCGSSGMVFTCFELARHRGINAFVTTPSWHGTFTRFRANTCGLIGHLCCSSAGLDSLCWTHLCHLLVRCRPGLRPSFKG